MQRNDFHKLPGLRIFFLPSFVIGGAGGESDNKITAVIARSNSTGTILVATNIIVSQCNIIGSTILYHFILFYVQLVARKGINLAFVSTFLF